MESFRLQHFNEYIDCVNNIAPLPSALLEEIRSELNVIYPSNEIDTKNVTSTIRKVLKEKRQYQYYSYIRGIKCQLGLEECIVMTDEIIDQLRCKYMATWKLWKEVHPQRGFPDSRFVVNKLLKEMNQDELAGALFPPHLSADKNVVYEALWQDLKRAFESTFHVTNPYGDVLKLSDARLVGSQPLDVEVETDDREVLRAKVSKLEIAVEDMQRRMAASQSIHGINQQSGKN